VAGVCKLLCVFWAVMVGCLWVGVLFVGWRVVCGLACCPVGVGDDQVV